MGWHQDHGFALQAKAMVKTTKPNSLGIFSFFLEIVNVFSLILFDCGLMDLKVSNIIQLWICTKTGLTSNYLKLGRVPSLFGQTQVYAEMFCPH